MKMCGACILEIHFAFHDLLTQTPVLTPTNRDDSARLQYERAYTFWVQALYDLTLGIAPDNSRVNLPFLNRFHARIAANDQ